MTLRAKTSVLAFLLVAVGSIFGATAAFAFQGHMFAAQGDLQRASNQLNMAVPDKAGHRVQALSLVSQALSQVQQGIAAGAR